MKNFIKSRFQNLIGLFLHIFPKNGRIFGSFASWLGFEVKIQYQNYDDLQFDQDKVDKFLKSGSDIDISLYDHTNDIQNLVNMMNMFGNVAIHEQDCITKLEWKCSDYPTLYIDIVHIYNTDSVDFTVNNWVVTKLDEQWKLDCRVKYLKHRPELTEQNIIDICTDDFLNKKINLMISPEKEISQRPKIVARTYKLLNKNFTFGENMITTMVVSKERYHKEYKYNTDDECPLCLEPYDNNMVVLDCGHGLHPICMQDFFVSTCKENLKKNGIIIPISIYTNSGYGKEAPSFRCPICRYESNFL